MYDDEVHAAFLAEEAARLGLLTGQPARVEYGDAYLTQQEPDYTVTYDEVDRAIVELAGQRGEDYTQTWAQVRALASGENDTEALADAVVALARGETVSLTSDNLSAAERQLLAKKSWALPDGSYPIRHKADLHDAANKAASGHGDHVSARKLIKKRARELGVDHRTLPGFGSGPSSTGGSESMGSGGGSGDGPSGGGDAAMTAAMRRAGVSEDTIRLAAGDGDGDEGTLSRIMRENPHMFKPTTHPVGKVSTRTRAHSTDEDPSDRQHPRDGGVVHPEVQRYLDMAEAGKEKPSGSVVSHGPRAYRPPGPAGKPQNRG